jgi:hypothetical protein
MTTKTTIKTPATPMPADVPTPSADELPSLLAGSAVVVGVVNTVSVTVLPLVIDVVGTCRVEEVVALVGLDVVVELLVLFPETRNDFES